MAGFIRQGSDAEFRAALRGDAVNGPVVERRLPKLGDTARIQSGRGLYSEKMREKMANLSGTPSFGANVATSSPEIRNPLLNLVNFYLPYDRRTLNQWIRYYDRFHPYIGNCLDIHGEFPVSDWRFTGISDPKVLQLYEDLKERTDMIQYCYDASREYELIGEVYSFWNWDDEEGMFSDYVMLNPDLLEVETVDWGWGKKTLFTYDPPAELKELIQRTGDPRMQELVESLDPVVRANLYAGKAIPLDDFNVMSMVRKAAPFEPRGTSIVLRIIKELMYEDKLREAQYAIADQQITPIQLWKLGDPASGYMPTEEDLQDFRSLLLAGRHDPLFTIVSHGALNLDLVGYTGKLLPVIPEFEWVAKRILVGLFTNESMVSGEGPCAPVSTVETLTDRGWLHYDDIDIAKDKIATVNPVNDELEFQSPIDAVCYEYDSAERGDLVEFSHKWLSFQSTPNHRTNVSAGDNVYGIVRADEVVSGNRLKNTVNWRGSYPSECNQVNGKWCVKVGTRDVPLDAYMAIVGLYLSEGSLEYEKKRPPIDGQEWRSKSVYDHLRASPAENLPNAVRITQTQATQDCGCFAAIERLLQETPYKVKYNQYESTKGWKGRFEFYDVELATHLRDNCGVGAVNKKLPRWLLQLPPDELTKLFTALMLGDGTYSRNARQGEYDSTSYNLASAVQELAIRIGYATRLVERDRQHYKCKDGSGRATMWRMYFSYNVDTGWQRRNSSINPRLSKNHISRVPFKGRVYCFEVPNHLYLVRHKGTVHVTGNTYSNAIVAMKILQGRYQAKREKLEKNFKRRLYEPVAKAHEVYDTSQAELSHRVRTRKKYLIPGMEWNFKLDLTDQTQRLQYMMTLRDKTSLPMKTICEVLDLDYNVVKINLKDEEGTVFDPVYQSVRQAAAENSGKVPNMPGGIGGGGGGGDAPPAVGGAGGEEGAAPAGGEEAPAGGAAPEAAPPEAA